MRFSAYTQRKEGVVLEKNRNCSTQIFQLQSLDISSINEDLTLSRVIDPSDELQNRALAAAIDTDDNLMVYKLTSL